MPRASTSLTDDELRRLRRLSYIMDNSIPLPGGFRAGLDGVIGLIPGVGDAVGAALSTYIIAVASRAGVPSWTLVRMVANVVVETVIGLIPILGDIFDVGWKANARNMALLDAHLYQERTATPTDWRLVTAVFLVLAVILVVIALIIYLLVKLIAALL